MKKVLLINLILFSFFSCQKDSSNCPLGKNGLSIECAEFNLINSWTVQHLWHYDEGRKKLYSSGIGASVRGYPPNGQLTFHTDSTYSFEYNYFIVRDSTTVDTLSGDELGQYSIKEFRGHSFGECGAFYHANIHFQPENLPKYVVEISKNCIEGFPINLEYSIGQDTFSVSVKPN